MAWLCAKHFCGQNSQLLDSPVLRKTVFCKKFMTNVTGFPNFPLENLIKVLSSPIRTSYFNEKLTFTQRT